MPSDRSLAFYPAGSAGIRGYVGEMDALEISWCGPGG